jgi:hypothetical protein
LDTVGKKKTPSPVFGNKNGIKGIPTSGAIYTNGVSQARHVLTNIGARTMTVPSASVGHYRQPNPNGQYNHAPGNEHFLPSLPAFSAFVSMNCFKQT